MRALLACTRSNSLRQMSVESRLFWVAGDSVVSGGRGNGTRLSLSTTQCTRPGVSSVSSSMITESARNPVSGGVAAAPDPDDVIGGVPCEDLVDEEALGLGRRNGIMYLL